MVAGSQFWASWQWWQLRCGPRVCSGSGGSFWLLLESSRVVVAAVGDHSWSLKGRQSELVSTPGVHGGGSEGTGPLLTSGQEVVEAWDCPWTPCRQCPAFCDHAHGEKGYNICSSSSLCIPPNNGDWSLRQPRIPPSILSCGHTDSSLLRLFPYSQPQSFPWFNLWSLSSSTQPSPARVCTTVLAAPTQLLYSPLRLWSSLSQLISPPVRGLPRVLEHFLSHSSLQRVQVPTWILSCFFFFLLITWKFSCSFSSLSLLAEFNSYFVRIMPQVGVLGWCKSDYSFRPWISNHYNWAQTYLY